MINGYLIRGYMRESGVSVKGIAQKLSVSKPFVSQVIHGVKKNQRVRNAIADALGRPVPELWPEEKTPSSGHNMTDSVGADSVVPEDGTLKQGKIEG